MSHTKKRIIRFVWDDYFMSIDWDTTLYAFEISRQSGGAKIFMVPPGVHFAMGPEDMLQFRLVRDKTTGLTEVVIDVTFLAEPDSLGVTDQVEEAERWVRDANALLQEARRRQGLV